MSRHQDAVYQWTADVTTHLPHLSKPQATVLALWSLGMVLARSCSLSAVTGLLAALLGRKEAAVRQQLREFCWDAKDKAGQHRQAVAVEPCFPALLRWVLVGYAGPQLALALDATSLRDRLVVLTISVVVRGCAIPVAWTVLPAGAKRAWRPEWLRVLRLLWRAIPADWTVLVLADRGLYARWLYRRIVRLGWHPFLRINLGGKFRPAGALTFRPLASFTPVPGQSWRGTGTAFATKDCQLACTLVAYWAEGCTDPWLLLTDLPPDACDACWYGLRAWIEHSFKQIKRGGWQWQGTHMTDPGRVARHWLAIAVATLWLVRTGTTVDDDLPESTFGAVDAALAEAWRARRATRLRLVSLFRRGWVTILVAWLRGEPLPSGRFQPEPWPAVSPLPNPHETAVNEVLDAA